MLIIVYYSIQDFRANIPCSLFPTPDSRLPRCAFRRRIKFATGRTAPDDSN
ncbi:hypothetical protein [Moorena sp. SIOASIH]|uniref:hypothetical protein n=1 Tax=Moorena sp. SIOASIH TaxID=2607817 RepID=UPI0025CE8074|nr:hypothetical protein [Moorena sp. SIOASIH]